MTINTVSQKPTMPPTSTSTATPTVTVTLTPTDTAAATVPVGPIPVPPSGSIDIEPGDLSLDVDPGVPGLQLATGTAAVRLATNAAHGFVLRVLRNGFDRKLAGGASDPGRLRLPRLDVSSQQATGAGVEDLLSAGPDGAVIASSAAPIPAGQVLEFEIQVMVRADFMTDPGTESGELRFTFVPSY